MDEMSMRLWLNRAFYADKKIKALEACAKQCRERAQSAAVHMGNTEQGKSDTAVNGTENALMRLAEMESKILRQIDELLDVSDEISDAISLLGSNDLETVLIHRYLLFRTVEETADIMSYSPRTVRDKQKKAVSRLCEIKNGLAESNAVFPDVFTD